MGKKSDYILKYLGPITASLCLLGQGLGVAETDWRKSNEPSFSMGGENALSEMDYLDWDNIGKSNPKVFLNVPIDQGSRQQAAEVPQAQKELADAFKGVEELKKPKQIVLEAEDPTPPPTLPPQNEPVKAKKVSNKVAKKPKAKKDESQAVLDEAEAFITEALLSSPVNPFDEAPTTTQPSPSPVVEKVEPKVEAPEVKEAVPEPKAVAPEPKEVVPEPKAVAAPKPKVAKKLKRVAKEKVKAPVAAAKQTIQGSSKPIAEAILPAPSSKPPISEVLKPTKNAIFVEPTPAPITGTISWNSNENVEFLQKIEDEIAESKAVVKLGPSSTQNFISLMEDFESSREISPEEKAHDLSRGSSFDFDWLSEVLPENTISHNSAQNIPKVDEKTSLFVKQALKNPVIIHRQTSILHDNLPNFGQAPIALGDWERSFREMLSKQNDQDLSIAQVTQGVNENSEPAVPQPAVTQVPTASGQQDGTILINFNNVSMIEYIRFVSKITNRNFIFDEEDLQFNITIISEEPTTIAHVLTALLQELRIRGLNMIEEGDNYIIYSNAKVNAPGKVVSPTFPNMNPRDGEMITQVFRLNTVTSDNAAVIVKPLLSDRSLVESLADSNNLIVTDFSANVEKIAQLLRSVDAPNSGVTLGEYVVKNGIPAALIAVATKIIEPIAQGQPVTLVPHETSNSIFIIASPFLTERIIPILQRLDQNDAATRIYNLNTFRFQEEGGEVTREAGSGRWVLDPNGNWVYQTNLVKDPASSLPPLGRWALNTQGEWVFIPGEGFPGGIQSLAGAQGYVPGQPIPFGAQGNAPRGVWRVSPNGSWVYELEPGETFAPGRQQRTGANALELPPGHIERTRFYIHKLQFRKGESIERAIRQIGQSLAESQTSNPDLLAAINSIQWLEPSNSLVFTGTQIAIDRVRELIDQIDTPLRQVYIEMLILDTTVADSLDYSVEWGSRSGGGDVSTGQGFVREASPLFGALSTGVVNPASGIAGVADAGSLLTSQNDGYTLGIIGQNIINKALGLEFSTIGALVRAVHDRRTEKILLNPKIITEDNTPAEIFVGINTPFKTQSISNDQGNTITNNFQFQDVGTSMKVTPYLGPTNIITLDIEQEVSSLVSGTNLSGNVNNSGGPTTNVSRTKTRVHVPDKCFVVMSGMIQDDENRFRSQVPCLGGLPIIGAFFSAKDFSDNKRNFMIFIRPELIDTEEQMDDLTKRQQDCYKIHDRPEDRLKQEVDEAFRWMNLTWDGAGDYDDPPCSRDRGL